MSAGETQLKARKGAIALRRWRAGALALAAAFALAGCAGKDKEKLGKENAGPCPLMGVLYDAARQVKFAGAEEKFENVAYTAEIRGVTGLCRYRGEEPIEMALDVEMAFGKGPAATGSAHAYRYWVAVARRDQAPVAKQFFDVNVVFPAGADRVAAAEHIEKIVIPRATSDVSGANFEILVGMDVTDKELEFNRDGKRFRINPAPGR